MKNTKGMNIYIMKYNKGEWSEAYAFVKLLGDGKVYAADGNLNKKQDECYPILKMIRDEISKYYVRSNDKEIVQVTDLIGNVRKEIPTKEFLNIATNSLSQIKNGEGASFEVPVLENFLKSLEIDQFKASSQAKADFKMEILDTRTDIAKDYTFSVKSELGSKATLLNASNATNFTYKIEGISDQEVIELNKITKTENKKWLKTRISKIQDGMNEGKYQVSFAGTQSEEFSSNLRLIDSNLPYIICVLLMNYYANEGISDIKTLTERLIAQNPLKLEENEKDLFYKTKIIELIKSATFGMMPNKSWNKQYSVTGGILTIKQNGDVLCHHIFYDKESLDEYLFLNTKLETASTSRYGTGNIYYLEGNYYFTLNLQIRMK